MGKQVECSFGLSLSLAMCQPRRPPRIRFDTLSLSQDATHLRYPTTLADYPPPLAVAAFPAPRGGFGPLTVTNCVAFAPLRGDDWAEQAAPVLIAPSKEGAESVASLAGEVWDKVLRGPGATVTGAVLTSAVVGGVLGGVVGGGSSSTSGSASFAGKASVTVVFGGGTYVRLVDGWPGKYNRLGVDPTYSVNPTIAIRWG